MLILLPHPSLCVLCTSCPTQVLPALEHKGVSSSLTNLPQFLHRGQSTGVWLGAGERKQLNYMSCLALNRAYGDPANDSSIVLSSSCLWRLDSPSSSKLGERVCADPAKLGGQWPLRKGNLPLAWQSMEDNFLLLPLIVMLARFSLRLFICLMVMKLYLHTGTMKMCSIFVSVISRRLG